MGLYHEDRVGKTDEYATPQDFYDKLNKEFNFALDPCATDENHKTDLYLTHEMDGLNIDWKDYLELEQAFNAATSNAVFVNPPYSKNKDWLRKCYEESLKGLTIVVLIPARTDTNWWADWVLKASEIRFIKGRLKFGSEKSGAKFPSVLVIFKNDPKPLHVSWVDRDLKKKV
jgi:site-specific DNA-methyltransferase (adenine-specific)